MSWQCVSTAGFSNGWLAELIAPRNAILNARNEVEIVVGNRNLPVNIQQIRHKHRRLTPYLNLFKTSLDEVRLTMHGRRAIVRGFTI